MNIKDILEAIRGEVSQLPVRVGIWQRAEIAASGTISSKVDVGGHFAYLQVVIPTITSAQLEVQVSETKDGTYQDFGQNALTVAGTGAYSDTWNLGGWRYIKIKSSVAQTTIENFEVRGITY